MTSIAKILDTARTSKELKRRSGRIDMLYDKGDHAVIGGPTFEHSGSWWLRVTPVGGGDTVHVEERMWNEMIDEFVGSDGKLVEDFGLWPTFDEFLNAFVNNEIPL